MMEVKHGVKAHPRVCGELPLDASHADADLAPADSLALEQGADGERSHEAEGAEEPEVGRAAHSGANRAGPHGVAIECVAIECVGIESLWRVRRRRQAGVTEARTCGRAPRERADRMRLHLPLRAQEGALRYEEIGETAGVERRELSSARGRAVPNAATRPAWHPTRQRTGPRGLRRSAGPGVR